MIEGSSQIMTLLQKKSIPTVMFYKAYNSKSSNHKHLLIK